MNAGRELWPSRLRARGLLSQSVEGTHQLWDIDRGEPVGPPVVNTPNIVSLWRLVLTVCGLQQRALVVASSRCGTAQTAKPAMPPMTHGATSLVSGLQPRRIPAGKRRQRAVGQALGCEDGPAHRRPYAASRNGPNASPLAPMGTRIVTRQRGWHGSCLGSRSDSNRSARADRA